MHYEWSLRYALRDALYTEELQSCARSELTVSGSSYLYLGPRDALYPLELSQSSSYLVSSLATCLGVGSFSFPLYEEDAPFM